MGWFGEFSPYFLETTTHNIHSWDAKWKALEQNPCILAPGRKVGKNHLPQCVVSCPGVNSELRIFYTPKKKTPWKKMKIFKMQKNKCMYICIYIYVYLKSSVFWCQNVQPPIQGACFFFVGFLWGPKIPVQNIQRTTSPGGPIPSPMITAPKKHTSSWWLVHQPIWKICAVVKLDHLLQFSGWK